MKLCQVQVIIRHFQITNYWYLIRVQMWTNDYRPLPAITYELVEVKHEVCTVDGNYTWIVDEGRWPKSSDNGQADPTHVDNSSTLADVSAAVIDSNGTAEGQDEDGAPLFKIVTPRRTEKKISTTTDVAWI